MRTPNQRLADIAIGSNVDEWIAERHAELQSWRKVANELRDRTHGQIDVAPPTLIAWHNAAQAAQPQPEQVSA
jgi:hypothetical protein